MRSLAVLVVLSHVPLVACDGTAPTSPSAGDPSAALTADQRCLGQEAAIDDATLARARALAVVAVHPESMSALAKGLDELAQAEPARHAYRTALLADPAWLGKGGLGHYQAGNGNKASARIAGFAKRLDQGGLAAAANAAYLEFEPRDFPEGRSTEVVWTSYRATMTINLTSAVLDGSFTEVLQAPRVITTGNGTVYAGAFNYPIELPNVSLTHVSTTLSAPAGGHPGDDDVLVSRLSERDPRIAFGAYTEAMASVAKAHPGMTLIYATVPLAAKGNWQRNWYNQAVRAYCAAEGKPLFDSAALLSHAPDGAMALDEQGERIAPAYLDPATGAIAKAGRERLARAWWWTLARLAGWRASPANAGRDANANQQ